MAPPSGRPKALILPQYDRNLGAWRPCSLEEERGMYNTEREERERGKKLAEVQEHEEEEDEEEDGKEQAYMV